VTLSPLVGGQQENATSFITTRVFMPLVNMGVVKQESQTMAFGLLGC
jgi:hypothetical protein